MPAVKSTLVPLPSNLMDINDTNDGLDVCERVTLLIIIVSAVCGALLSLVLVLLLCCIVALTKTRVRQRNVRFAGSVRPTDLNQSRMFHLQNNVCYGTRNGVRRQHSLPHNISLNASWSMSASPTTDTKPCTHQYAELIQYHKKDMDPTEEYDKLEPKSKDKDPSSDHDYQNTTQKLLLHQTDNASHSQEVITLLPHTTTLTHPQATAQGGLSDGDDVNEIDGPFITSLPTLQVSRPPPASLHVNLKRHCTTSSTKPSNRSQPHRPRDYEVPEPSRRLKKNVTMKW